MGALDRMSARRRPLQGLAASADSADVSLLYALAHALYSFLDASPPLLLCLLYNAIVIIPLVLLHEYGHAVAASSLLGVSVEVSFGTAGQVAQFRLGQIVATVNAVNDPLGVGGQASFDASRATARDIVWIAVAGPLTSLAGTVFTALLLSTTPRHGVAHDLLWAATLTGVLATLNIVPFTYRQRRGGPLIRTDGRLALDALRVILALR